MLSRRLMVTAGWGACLAPGWAMAHGFHAAFTVIEMNPRTKALEIIHRIFIQDFEILLTARAGRPVTLEDSPDAEKLIESYLLGVFSVKAIDGSVLKPVWVGMKLQVDTVFVYQEIKNTGTLPGLIVSDQILTETHSGQVNSVNVTQNGRTQTLIFMADDTAQTVAF